MAQYIIDRATATWGGQTIFGGSAGITLSPASCALTTTGDDQDTTAWTGSTVTSRTSTVGLRTWTASFTGYTSTAVLGSTGLITASGFSVAYARAWDMTINCEAAESTYFNSPSWRSFIPGLLSASGSFETFADNGTALVLAPTAATGTFRLSDQATDQTIAATINQLSLNSTQTIGDIVMATIGYKVSGAMTLNGSGTFTPILGTGTLAPPAAAELIITSTTSRTFTGSAFWTSVRIRCAVDQLIEVEATFQGSDTLTAA